MIGAKVEASGYLAIPNSPASQHSGSVQLTTQPKCNLHVGLGLGFDGAAIYY